MNAIFKKTGIFLLVCMLIFSSMSIVTSAEDTDTTFRIVHTNDLHGYYKNTGRGPIGFSALKAVIDQQDADLVLDAGDTFHGQSFATVEQGKSISELMDAVGYDAMTPGNHDWSYTAARLKALDADSSFEILAANVVSDDGSQYFDNSYIVKNITADDGTVLKVGVFGVIDDEMYSSTLSTNVEGIKFEEEAAVATATAQTLRTTENCDIVIALTHQNDCEGFIAATSGIDIVIAGHEHLVLDKFYTDADGKQVKLVEAGYYFYNIGVLTVTYDTNTNTIESMSEAALTADDTASLSDADIDAKVTEVEQRESVILQNEIGQSSVSYMYSWEDIRVAEQQIGRIVTASYLDWTGADVAMENAGGIRSGIPQGTVTYGDIISISPYGNVLVVKELTGQQILDIIEYSLEINRVCDEIYTLQKEAVANGEDPYQYSWPDNSGSALQIGGIKLEYDLTKPVGSRISNATIGGTPVDVNRLYKVATNNYVSENSSYTGMAETEILSEYGTCEQALNRYIEKGTFETAANEANLVSVSADTEIPTEAVTEETQSTSTEAETTPSTVSPTSKPTTVPSASPSTGEASNVPVYFAVLTLSVASIIVILRKRKAN